MWYSVTYWNVQGSYTGNNQITGPGGTFENFAMDSNSNRETHKCGLNLKGNNWLINGVWLQHAGPGIWVQGTNGTVENNRINNSFADGHGRGEFSEAEYRGRELCRRRESASSSSSRVRQSGHSLKWTRKSSNS